MTTRILLIDNSSFEEEDIFFVRTHTNIKCLQVMRYSFQHYQLWPYDVYKRGVPIGRRYKFTLVKYIDVPQVEPGDTLEHTFSFPHWPVGQTRYYYFHATTAGFPSITSSPLITLKR